MPKKKPSVSEAAAALGSITSPKKAAASRANGKLGGRPKSKKQERLSDRDIKDYVERRNLRNNSLKK